MLSNPYLDTIDRMEPDLTMVDRDAALASIAISLKRIADALERKEQGVQVVRPTAGSDTFSGGGGSGL